MADMTHTYDKLAAYKRFQTEFTGPQAELLADALGENRDDGASTRRDLAAAVAQLTATMEKFAAGTRSDIAELRGELANTKTELKADISKVQSDLTVEIIKVRSDLKADVFKVQSDLALHVATNETRIERLKLGLIAAVFSAAVAVFAIMRPLLGALAR